MITFCNFYVRGCNLYMNEYKMDEKVLERVQPPEGQDFRVFGMRLYPRKIFSPFSIYHKSVEIDVTD